MSLDSESELNERSLLNPVVEEQTKNAKKAKCEYLNPDFVKVGFDIKLSDVKHNFLDEKQAQDLSEIKDKIRQLSSLTLFHWKKVPILFPDSFSGSESDKEFNKNLFILPSFNELEEIATDNNGETKRLNKQQLDSIKKEGKFEVESAHFPGKTHKWAIAKWLQKGYKLSNETFFSDVANSLHLLIITAKNRFGSGTFSILEGLKAWKRGAYDLLDKLIGLPHKYVLPYDVEYLNELQKFLVQDLKVDPFEQQTYETLIEKLGKIDLKKPLPLNKDKLKTPYLYRTPENKLVDLRLFDNELMERINPILTKMLEMTDNEKELIIKIREQSVKLLKSENFSNEEIAEKTNEILFKEFFKSLNEKLLNNAELDSIAPGIAKILIQNAKSIIYTRKICDDVAEELRKHLDQYEANLKKRYRVKSLVKDWLYESINEEREKYVQKNLFEVHLRSIKKCYEEDLFQSAYFIERELIFLNQKSQALIENFKKNKAPFKNFVFNRKIWLPKNYIIEETKYSNQQKSYSLQTWTEYRNNSNYPFWRWVNFFKRTWVYFCNSFYIFGIVIPFASPFSYRALFSSKPFYPAKTIDQNRGILIRDLNSKTLTYFSRLRSIWSNVKNSRAKFESIPDKGLIGKTIQRFFNKIWNYIIKGAFGSLGLTLIYPLMCLLISTGSLAVALLTPLWYPILSVFHHLGFILVYDWDYCGNSFLSRIIPLFTIVFFRFFICGTIQPICALATATIICPVTSLFVAAFAVTRKCMRKTWDSFMFYCVLKCQARVPSHDTFVARRVEGPGLASTYFYQAQPEQTLAALEANLEIKLLNSYLSFIEKKLHEPLHIYEKLFNPMFNPFSFHIDHNNGPYSELAKEVSNYKTKYQQETNKRIEKIRKSISNNLNNIRLNESDLNILIHESKKIVRDVYENSILKYENKTVQELFEEHGIVDNDWTTFTGIILEEIFGTGILTHLEDSDNYFSLEVNHLNLKKYSEMIAYSKLRDDLDLVSTIYNPKSGHIVINMPYLGREMFSVEPATFYGFGNNEAVISVPPRLPKNAGVIAVHVFNHGKPNEEQINYKKNLDEVLNDYFKTSYAN